MLTEDLVKFRERLESAMKNPFSGGCVAFLESDLELFRAIMRPAIDFDTACISMMIPDKMISELRKLPEIKEAIRQAEAQFKVMAHGRLWEEGGSNGAKLLLEMSGKSKGDDIYG